MLLISEFLFFPSDVSSVRIQRRRTTGRASRGTENNSNTKGKSKHTDFWAQFDEFLAEKGKAWGWSYEATEWKEYVKFNLSPSFSNEMTDFFHRYIEETLHQEQKSTTTPSVTPGPVFGMEWQIPPRYC